MRSLSVYPAQFALRSPYPRDLYLAEDRGDGWENDDTILDAAKGSALVVCAWGNHGRLDQRGARVARMLEASGCHLWCFGLTGSQQPRHPLYLRSDSQLLQMPDGLVGAAGDGEQR